MISIQIFILICSQSFPIVMVTPIYSRILLRNYRRITDNFLRQDVKQGTASKKRHGFLSSLKHTARISSSSMAYSSHSTLLKIW
ncbi:unnamed protein product [Brassica oleracea]